MRDGKRGRLGLLGDPYVVDTALAAFVAVIAVAQQASSTIATPATRTLGLIFAALLPLALILRRRSPLVVHGIMLAAVVVWALLGVATTGAGLTLMVSLYAVAAYRDVRASVPALVVTVVVGLFVEAMMSGGPSDAVELIAFAAAAWWLGHTVGTRRRQGEALAAYAEELARTREQLAEQRVAEERLRIAREMHDVVAHSLGVVAVQAGVADHLLEQDPEQARRAVATIGDVARAGLKDMRRTVGLLRTADAPSEHASAPRVADVTTLVDDLRTASQLDVALAVTGAPARPLDPALEMSVYRVVQEALTNVRKHAPGSHVEVLVRYGPEDVDVEIVDDGSLAPLDLPGSGNGLLGMRERVSIFGGTLEAAPQSGGGFRVAARFPLAGGTA